MTPLEKLRAKHKLINNFIANFDEVAFMNSDNGKWSPAQHIDHLYLALKATNNAIKWPSWLLQWKFGKCNRNERNYEQIEAKYKEKLQTTNVSNNPFLNSVMMPKVELIHKYGKEQKRFENRMNSLSSSQKAETIIPHPLLGKLNLNEFIEFTRLHTTMHAISIGAES